MSKYILIVITPVSPGEDKGYYVYGFEGPGISEEIAKCDDIHTARDKAFEYRGQCPVWQGGRYELVLEKLAR